MKKHTEFSCEVCGKSPENERIVLFRTGEKGPNMDPHWRCHDHLTTPIDPLVKDVCDALTTTQQEV